MNSKKRKFDPFNSIPKTSDEFIEYAEIWLSGDAGWRPEDVREYLTEFREVIRGELAESGKAPVLKTGDV